MNRISLLTNILQTFLFCDPGLCQISTDSVVTIVIKTELGDIQAELHLP